MPEECRTEVFFLPAASHVEKDGTFTQTQRMLQWREKAVEPPGDCRSRAVVLLPPRPAGPGAAGRRRPSRATGRCCDLAWDYPVHGEHDEPSAEAVLREINGYQVADGQPLSAYTELRHDGSTACGCWIYSGVYADGVNQAARRKPGGEQDWVAPEWGWAWPANRRILYNRASADPEGRPWSERKAYVWWDEDAGQVDRPRRARLRADQAAVLPPADGRERADGDRRRRPVHHAGRREGAGCSRRSGWSTGRCRPTTSRPSRRSATRCYGQQANPTRKSYERPDNVTNPSPPEPDARSSRTSSPPAG